MKGIRYWKEKCLVLGALAAAALGMWLLQIPCPWKALLGIPCPGCGMTRAWLSVLRLDLAGAFRLHPMFWSVPVMALWWLLEGNLSRNRIWQKVIPAAIGTGFVLQWIYQLILYFY